jgi:hypothetical protein
VCSFLRGFVITRKQILTLYTTIGFYDPIKKNFKEKKEMLSWLSEKF